AVQGILPRRYARGDESPGDAPDVEQWWRQVAEEGSATLQCCLAEFYQFGHGVRQDEAEALRWYQQAATSGDLVALKRAAWLQATSANPRLRDGSSAVRFAEQAAAATKQHDPSILDTLAAAYAEAGQFEKAVRTQKEAVALSKREDE